MYLIYMFHQDSFMGRSFNYNRGYFHFPFLGQVWTSKAGGVLCHSYCYNGSVLWL